jgi:hypothetical protein
MITIFDDFIKDENLLKEIAEDKTFFQDPGVYYYWKGWWNDENPEANTTKRKLIEYIWRYNAPLREIFTINGFEYWTGVQEADPQGRFRNYLEMHYDDDVEYRKATGDRMSPVIGCVYYPPGSEFTGGALNVYTDGEHNPPDVALCRPNRLIIFNAGQIPHRVDTVLTGTRRAIAINLWSEEPYSSRMNLFAIEP